MSVEVEVGGVYEQAADLTPAGTIVAYGGSSAPGGWFLCDGSAVNRISESRLFVVIGTSFGEGDGSTTFNLPDFRGMFLRGVDGIAGRDVDASSRVALLVGGNTGNEVGSYQSDAIRNITGAFSGTNVDGQVANGCFYLGASRSGAADGSNDKYVNFDASRVVPTGNDNRPKNIYVNYIIKK